MKIITDLGSEIAVLELPDSAVDGNEVIWPPIPGLGEEVVLELFDEWLVLSPSGRESLKAVCRIDGKGPGGKPVRLLSGMVRLDQLDQEDPDKHPFENREAWLELAGELWPEMGAETGPGIRALRLGQAGLMLEVAGIDDGDYRLVEFQRGKRTQSLWRAVVDLHELDSPPATQCLPQQDRRKVGVLIKDAWQELSETLEPDQPRSLDVLFESSNNKRHRFIQPDWSIRLGASLWRPGWCRDDGVQIDFSDHGPSTARKGSGNKKKGLTFILDRSRVDRVQVDKVEKTFKLVASGGSLGSGQNGAFHWHYANVEKGSKRYPPTWVRYRLDRCEAVPADPLAEQQAGLTAPLTVILSDASGKSDSAWELTLGLAVYDTQGARIRLSFKKGASPELTLVEPHVRALSPALCLYCGELPLADRPPQDLDLVSSTCEGRFEFVQARQEPSTACLRANFTQQQVELQTFGVEGDTGDRPVVTLFLPGPAAGLDTALDNRGGIQPPADGNEVNAAVSNTEWSLWQGRIEVSAGKRFQWLMKQDDRIACLKLSLGDPQPGPPAGVESISPLMPWGRWWLEQGKYRFQPHHRNLVQERSEHVKASADRVSPIPQDTAVAARDFRRALRDGGGDMTREPFESFVGESQQPLSEFLPGSSLLSDDGETSYEPQVRFRPSTGSDEPVPRLELTGWPEKKNELSLERQHWLDAPWRWRAPKAKDGGDSFGVLHHAPEDGAATRSTASAIPPIFRHPKITAMTGLMIRETPWVLFSTDDNRRLLQWLPEKDDSQPVTFPSSTMQSQVRGEIRCLAATSTSRSTAKYAVAIGTNTHLHRLKGTDENLTELGIDGESTTGVTLKSFEPKEGEFVALQFVARDGEAAYLLAALNIADHGRLLCFPVDGNHFAPQETVLEIDDAPIKDFAYASQGRLGMLAVILDGREQSSDSLRVFCWKDALVSDEFLSDPIDSESMTKRLQPPVTAVGKEYSNLKLQRPIAWLTDTKSTRAEIVVLALADNDGGEENSPPGLVGWRGRLFPEAADEVAPVRAQSVASRALQRYLGGRPHDLAIGPMPLDLWKSGFQPPYLTVIGADASDPARDRFLRFSIGEQYGPMGIGAPVPGPRMASGSRGVSLLGASAETEDEAAASKNYDKFTSQRGTFGLSGGDDGVVRCWDIASVEVLSESSMADAVYDNTGVVTELAGSEGGSAGGTDSNWHLEASQVVRQRQGKEVWETCLALTRLGGPLRLAEGLGKNTQIRLVVDGLKLQGDGSAAPKTWKPLSDEDDAPLPVTPLGCLGVFGDETNTWPRLLGLPLTVLAAEEFEFSEGIKEKTGPVAVRLEKIVLRAVLGNPALANDPERLPAAMDEADSHGKHCILSFSRDWAGSESFVLDSVAGDFFWRFSLSLQRTTSFSLPALSGRLAVLTGKVEWKKDSQRLVFSLDRKQCKVQALGGLRPIGANSVERLVLDGASDVLQVREEWTDDSDLRTYRNLSGPPPDGADAELETVGSWLLPARDSLSALTADTRQLLLHDVESGELRHHFDAGIVRAGLLPVRNENDPLEVFIVRKDGTVFILGLVEYPADGGANEPPKLKSAESPIALRLHAGRPVLAADWGLYSLAADSTETFALLLCDDGKAQLWSRSLGRRLHEFSIRNARVTAAAMGPNLPESVTDEFGIHTLRKGECVTIGIGGSDGSTRIYACQLGPEDGRPKNKILYVTPLKTYFDSEPVASISIEHLGKTEGDDLFALSCFEFGADPRFRGFVRGSVEGIFEKVDEKCGQGRILRLTNNKLSLHLQSEKKLFQIDYDPSPSTDDKTKIHENSVSFDAVVSELREGRDLLQCRLDGNGSITILSIQKDLEQTDIDHKLASASLASHPKLGNFILGFERNTGMPLVWRRLKEEEDEPWEQLTELPPEVVNLITPQRLAAVTPCDQPQSGILFKTDDARIGLWDPRDGSERILPIPFSEGLLATGYVSGELHVAAAEREFVRLWNTRTGCIVREFTTADTVDRIELIESGSAAVLAIRSGKGRFQFWEVRDKGISALPSGNLPDDDKMSFDSTLIQSGEEVLRVELTWKPQDGGATNKTKLTIALYPIGEEDKPLQPPWEKTIEKDIPITDVLVGAEAVGEGNNRYLLLLFTPNGQANQEQPDCTWILVSSEGPMPGPEKVFDATLDPGHFNGTPRLFLLTRTTSAAPVTVLKHRGLGMDEETEIPLTKLPDTRQVRILSEGDSPLFLLGYGKTSLYWRVHAPVAESSPGLLQQRLGPVGSIDTRRVPAVASVSAQGQVTLWDRELGRILQQVPLLPDEDFGAPVTAGAYGDRLWLVYERGLKPIGLSGGVRKLPGITAEDGVSFRDAAITTTNGSKLRVAAVSKSFDLDFSKASATQELVEGTALLGIRRFGNSGASTIELLDTRTLRLSKGDQPIMEFAVAEDVNAFGACDFSAVDGTLAAVAMGQKIEIWEQGDAGFVQTRSYEEVGGAITSLSLWDTREDGPRLLLGVKGQNRQDWKVLTLCDFVRIRKNEPPVFDLAVGLGSEKSLAARITTGRKVELQLLGDEQLEPVFGPKSGAAFHTWASIASQDYYGFQVRRSNAVSRVSGVLLLRTQPGGDELHGQLLLEEHLDTAKAKITIGSTVDEAFEGPRIRLMSLPVHTTRNWQEQFAYLMQRCTWRLTRTKNGTGLTRLLLVDQPMGGEETRCVAHIDYKMGTFRVNGLLPLTWKRDDEGTTKLNNTGQAVVLVAPGSVDGNAKRSGDGSQRLPGQADLFLPSAGDGPLVGVLCERKDPVFTRSSEQHRDKPILARFHSVTKFKKVEDISSLALDFSGDPDLFDPLPSLPDSEPALAHQSALATGLRVELDPKAKTIPLESSAVEFNGSGEYLMMPLLEVDGELKAPLIPVTLGAEERVSRHFGYQVENLFALQGASEDTQGKFPRCVLSVSSGGPTRDYEQLIDSKRKGRARKALGATSILVHRVLHSGGPPSFEFVDTGSEPAPFVRYPGADEASENKGDSGVTMALIDKDPRWLGPKVASGFPTIGTTNACAPEPTGYLPVAGFSGGKDRTRQICARLSERETDNRSYLRLGVSPVWREERVDAANLGNVVAFDMPLVDEEKWKRFLPTQLTWRTGSIKPGTRQLLSLRPMSVNKVGARIHAGSGFTLGLREPQRFELPQGAEVRFEKCEFTIDESWLTTLNVEWTERLGQLQFPGGEAGTNPVLKVDDASSDKAVFEPSPTEAKLVSITQRIEEYLLLSADKPDLLYVPESGSEAAVDLFLITSFKLQEPLQPQRPSLPSGGALPAKRSVHIVISMKEDGAGVQPLIQPASKIFTESEVETESPYHVYRLSSEFWKSLETAKDGEVKKAIDGTEREARFDIFWLESSESELDPQAALYGQNAPKLERYWASGLSATVAIISRYDDALALGNDKICESTLAFGPAATSSGSKISVQGSEKIYLEARGSFKTKTPALSSYDRSPARLYLVKYFTEGQTAVAKNYSSSGESALFIEPKKE